MWPVEASVVPAGSGAACRGPAFLPEVLPAPLAGEAPEPDWLEEALAGRPRAVLWRSAPALVVPASYRRHDRLQAASEAFAARGWPVRVRRSGGGLVPQGPGILNLSLAWRADGPGGGAGDAVYAHLCAMLSRGLARLGLASRPAAVAGSFCDGRWNLAADLPDGPRKLAGTAQYWRRREGRSAVLAHALLLVEADTAALTALANEFEAALGSGRRYEPAAVTDVAGEWRRIHGTAAPADLVDRVCGALCLAIAH